MHTAISVLVLILGVLVCGAASARTDCSETRAVLWLHVPENVLEDLLNHAVPARPEGLIARLCAAADLDAKILRFGF